MKIFPYSLLRISGDSFDNFELLSSIELRKSLDGLEILNKNINILKTRISSYLFNIIAEIKDVELRRKLLNFRRDIFNERRMSEFDCKYILDNLDDNIKESCQKYFTSLEESKTLHEALYKLYNEESTKIKNNFKYLINNETFKNGLLLSSESLESKLNQYINNKEKKQEKIKIENSLIKYLSRFYSKTSPFSTFTSLGIVDIKSDNNNTYDDLILGHDGKLNRISRVKLNNRMFIYLSEVLTISRNTRKYFKIKLNPSIKVKEKICTFFVNNYNMEVFQNISLNDELIIILGLLKGRSIKYSDFLNSLVYSNKFDASLDELDDYLQKLISFGLLEFDLGISGLDKDWDSKFINLIEPYAKDDNAIEELVHNLKILSNNITDYCSSNNMIRKRILNYSFEKYNNIYHKLHKAAGLPEIERQDVDNYLLEYKKKGSAENYLQDNYKGFNKIRKTASGLKPKNIFYEDTAYKNKFIIDYVQIKKVMELFIDVVSKTEIFEDRHLELAKMSNYFIHKFGSKADIKLIDFYQSYYKDYKKDEEEFIRKYYNDEEKIEKLKLKQNNISKVKKIRDFQNKLQSQFFSNINSRLNKHEGYFNISKNDIPMLENIKFSSYNAHSFGCHIQLYKDNEDNNEIKGVFNLPFLGFGKMFSRFLYLFDNKIEEQIKHLNSAVVEDNGILAEINDSFVHNANLHPLLAPFEISFPGCHSICNLKNQISFEDIYIKYDNNYDSIYLFHNSTQKKIFVLNMGFVSSSLRSAMFKLLENFSLGQHLILEPFIQIIRNNIPSVCFKYEKKIDYIKIYPRISYDKNLILSRKMWLIPQSILPLKDNNESDSKYFLRVNDWKTQLNLPNEIFLIRYNLEMVRQKPQYISFSNPLLINLLAKEFKKVSNQIAIHEMLPNSSQLLKFNNKRYVSEFVFQWYKDTNE